MTRIEELIVTSVRSGGMLVANIIPYAVVWLINVSLILVLGALLVGLLFLMMYVS